MKEKEKEGKEGGGSGGRMARKKGERKRWSYDVVNPVDCCPKPEREHSQQRHEEFSSIGRGMP